MGMEPNRSVCRRRVRIHSLTRSLTPTCVTTSSSTHTDAAPQSPDCRLTAEPQRADEWAIAPLRPTIAPVRHVTFPSISSLYPQPRTFVGCVRLVVVVDMDETLLHAMKDSSAITIRPGVHAFLSRLRRFDDVFVMLFTQGDEAHFMSVKAVLNIRPYFDMIATREVDNVSPVLQNFQTVWKECFPHTSINAAPFKHVAKVKSLIAPFVTLDPSSKFVLIDNLIHLNACDPSCGAREPDTPYTHIVAHRCPPSPVGTYNMLIGVPEFVAEYGTEKTISDPALVEVYVMLWDEFLRHLPTS